MQRCLFNNSANTFVRNGTTAVKIDVFLARWHHHTRAANEGSLTDLAEFYIFHHLPLQRRVDFVPYFCSTFQCNVI